MSDVAHELLGVLGRTTLALAIAAAATGAVLRWSRAASPAVHRAGWIIALLVGWAFMRLSVAVPWYDAPMVASVDPVASEMASPPIELNPMPLPFVELHTAPTELSVPPAELSETPAPLAGEGRVRGNGAEAADADPTFGLLPLGETLAATPGPVDAPPATIEIDPTARPDEVAAGSFSDQPRLGGSLALPDGQPGAPPITSDSEATTFIPNPQPPVPNPWRAAPVIALAIWAAGAFVLVATWLFGYARFARRLPPSRPAEEAWTNQWRELLAARGVRRPIPLRITDNLGPMLCRLPRGYELLLPAALWRELDARQRAAILRHELAHYERCDVWKSLAARVLALPHWFNPFAWWAVRRFDEAAEWACDQAAASDEYLTAYAAALVRLGEAVGRHASYSPAARGRTLAGRVRRLLALQRTEDSAMKRIVLVAAAMCLAALVLVRVELVAKEPAADGGLADIEGTGGLVDVAADSKDNAASLAEEPAADREASGQAPDAGAAGKEKQAAKPPERSDEEKRVVQALVEAGRRHYQACRAAYATDTITFGEVLDASTRLRAAEQAAATNDEETAAADRAHLVRVKQLQAQVTALFEAGARGGEAEKKALADYFVAEAERRVLHGERRQKDAALRTKTYTEFLSESTPKVEATIAKTVADTAQGIAWFVRSDGSATAKTALRYDGKGFAEWAAVLRTELSAKRRVEAIGALAAFAQRGYGREAGREIVEAMRGERGYKFVDTSIPDGSLLQASVLAFRAVPTADAVAVLGEALKSDDATLRLFAVALLQDSLNRNKALPGLSTSTPPNTDGNLRDEKARLEVELKKLTLEFETVEKVLHDKSLLQSLADEEIDENAEVKDLKKKLSQCDKLIAVANASSGETNTPAVKRYKDQRRGVEEKLQERKTRLRVAFEGMQETKARGLRGKIDALKRQVERIEGHDRGAATIDPGRLTNPQAKDAYREKEKVDVEIATVEADLKRAMDPAAQRALAEERIRNDDRVKELEADLRVWDQLIATARERTPGAEVKNLKQRRSLVQDDLDERKEHLRAAIAEGQQTKVEQLSAKLERLKHTTNKLEALVMDFDAGKTGGTNSALVDGFNGVLRDDDLHVRMAALRVASRIPGFAGFPEALHLALAAEDMAVATAALKLVEELWQQGRLRTGRDAATSSGSAGMGMGRLGMGQVGGGQTPRGIGMGRLGGGQPPTFTTQQAPDGSYGLVKSEPPAAARAGASAKRETEPSAAQIQAERTTELIVPDLVRLLEHRDREIRSRAVSALRLLGTRAKPALPLIMPWLQSDDSGRWAQAIGLVQLIGPDAAEAVPAIAELLNKHGVELERNTAKMAISALFLDPAAAKQAVPGLIAIVEKQDGELRVAAIQALGTIGPAAADAIPALEKLSSQGDKREVGEVTAHQAAEALKRIRGETEQSKEPPDGM
ncbi:MAG: hypothetical protein HYX69_21790 [Planctomycetia bacterium]|nr:hypothetical protein [Planctomycetia bacterium]